MFKLKVLFISMFAFLMGSCNTDSRVATIDVKALERILSAQKVQLVDVRTIDEYNSGRIGDAVNIDVMSQDFLDKAKAKLDSKQPVYVYCQSGRRSLNAAAILDKNGFKAVNLEGGINAWQGNGLPVELLK